ncbi:MAG: hypothetical protein AAGH68_05495 [Pseudomonadota bacterium]
MKMRRELAVALTAALMAGTAWADHPGAIWSVERLEVRANGAAAEALRGDVHSALRAANEVYFYGAQPVRMVATVSGSGRVSVDLIDIATGEVLIRGAKMGADGLETEVLAWMDGLDCAGGTCGGDAPAESTVQIAAAPAAQPVKAKAAEPAKVAWPQKVTGVLSPEEPQQIARAETGQPVPRPRPGAEATPDLDGLRSVAIARNPDLSIKPIRISRFDTRGLSPISYSADDRLVLRVPLARVPTATQTLPKPQEAPSKTLVGRWVDSVASFLGFSEPEPPKPGRTVAALPSSSIDTVSAYAPSGTALEPSEQWKPKPAAPAAEQRVAALSTTPVGGRSTLPAPQSARSALPQAEPRPARQAVASASTPVPPVAAAPEYTSTGLKIVRSPGLGLPKPYADSAASPQVTPIRLAQASRGARNGVKKDLAVKIHPEVFGKYSSAAAERLFGGYGSSAPVRLVSAAPEASGSSQSVDRILANRGLALDSKRYAKAERVFWSGRTGSRGFWITLPQVSASSYVLVASSKASVIANVYARGSSVQVSDAVAKALGLAPGQWSDVQIIALKPVDRTAARKKVTVTR